MWRPDVAATPDVATPRDIDAINRLFSDAFTDRYHRDGLGAVRVPELNPAVWRYALAVAGDGAFVWRDDGGSIVAFNLVHASGAEGWMGPLAVRPDAQGQGLGRRIVGAGVERLVGLGCRVIGLETMPRTIDNIGFYSRLGFRPGCLTISMVRDLTAADRVLARGSTSEPLTPDACRPVLEAAAPGVDFSRELAATFGLTLGGTTAVPASGPPAGFALWHSVPLAGGRSAEELRVLKLAVRDLERFGALVDAVMGRAADLGCRRVVIRCQTAYRDAYALLVDRGFRVQWTDLRMTLTGHEEPPPARAVLFSNWEI